MHKAATSILEVDTPVWVLDTRGMHTLVVAVNMERVATMKKADMVELSITRSTVLAAMATRTVAITYNDLTNPTARVSLRIVTALNSKKTNSMVDAGGMRMRIAGDTEMVMSKSRMAADILEGTTAGLRRARVTAVAGARAAKTNPMGAVTTRVHIVTISLMALSVIAVVERIAEDITANQIQGITPAAMTTEDTKIRVTHPRMDKMCPVETGVARPTAKSSGAVRVTAGAMKIIMVARKDMERPAMAALQATTQAMVATRLLVQSASTSVMTTMMTMEKGGTAMATTTTASAQMTEWQRHIKEAYRRFYSNHKESLDPVLYLQELGLCVVL